ncbi:MAG: sugar ABC transporter substrate-binding protein [Lachnospiraceae bacterium]|jgi:ribose transport system substrate-binding protein
MKKRIFTIIMVLGMVIALLAACSNGGKGGSGENTSTKAANEGDASTKAANGGDYSNIKVGYCPPTLTDAFLASIANGVGKYCEEYGMTFTATEGEANIETQIQQTENFISMGCDVIICQPVNLNAFETVVKKARDEGVKILFWADDPTYDVDACYLSVAEVQGKLCGEMAVVWVDKTFPDAKDGDVKVAWLTTQYDDRPDAKNRQDAMIDVIKDDPRFDVVFRKDNLNTTVETMNAMNECLALNPDINVVFAFSDAHAMGANSAVMADKSLDYSKIAIFAGSATPEGIDLVNQSAEDKSVIRGLVTFGEGDSYYKGGADTIKGLIDGTIGNHEVFFCDHGAYNSIGYESSFDATEYAKEYADKKAAGK